MAEDPVRLLEDEGSELMHSLLSAVREEQPKHAAMQRTLTVLGVGTALTAVASGSSALSAGSAAGGFSGAVSLGSAKGAAASRADGDQVAECRLADWSRGYFRGLCRDAAHGCQLARRQCDECVGKAGGAPKEAPATGSCIRQQCCESAGNSSAGRAARVIPEVRSASRSCGRCRWAVRAFTFGSSASLLQC